MVIDLGKSYARPLPFDSAVAAKACIGSATRAGVELPIVLSPSDERCRQRLARPSFHWPQRSLWHAQGGRQVSRFDHPLRLDNVLFVVAMVVAAAFAAERFYAQEDEKTAIAQARELRNSAVARVEESCIRTEPPPTRQSDIQEPCSNQPVHRK
jgi:hypothetical protein